MDFNLSNWFNGISNAWNSLMSGEGQKAFEQYHKNGIIPNIWKGITGQLSNEITNQENLDYAKSMTQAQWERDDNAMQRQIADFEAAGISPLAATGQGAMNSQPVTSGPQNMPATSLINPFQAVSNLSNSLSNWFKIDETKRHNQETEQDTDERLAQDARKIDLQASELDIQNKDVESQVKYRASIIANESKRIDETIRSNQANENIQLDKNELERISEENKRYFQEIQHQAGGSDVPYKVYNNYNEWLSARDAYFAAYSAFIDELGKTRTSSTRSQSGSIEGGANALGIGGANIGGSQSSSKSEYSDVSKQQQAMFDKFQKEHPFPIYIFKED